MSKIQLLIERRGGPTKFAAELSLASGWRLTQQHVSYWARKGHVPSRWVEPLVSLLRRDGQNLSADDLLELLPSQQTQESAPSCVSQQNN